MLASAFVHEPELIHRDDELLVVNKPPGLPTTAPSSGEASLVGWVDERFPHLRAHPTSRLDSPVSGLVTFALTKAANRRLLDARRAGTYSRLYLGITLAVPEPVAGVWSWSISLDPRSPKHRRAGSGAGMRDASTRYEVAAQATHGALLRLKPETGRTHQLRVHASKAGVPLLGDRAYEGERRCVLPDGSVVTARRVMLHCRRIEFPGPSGQLRFDAEVPNDMEKLWLGLGGSLDDLAHQ
jgi:23S rRNA-/tRNA-specific pseudouridylate synthase